MVAVAVECTNTVFLLSPLPAVLSCVVPPTVSDNFFGKKEPHINKQFCHNFFCLISLPQGCYGQGKLSGKWKGKVREFCGWPVKFRNDLESKGKVREWLWQAVFRKFIYSIQEGKGCTISWDSLSPFPSALGSTLKGKNLLPLEQILSFKSNPQIWSDAVNTIKVKKKKWFFLSVRGYGKL